MEATVYALLAGYQNFGAAIAASLGTAATTAAGVVAVPAEDDCDFANLPLLILVCHVAVPLLLLPLTFILVPNARMTDSLQRGRSA